MALLEGGYDSIATSSGMGAVNVVYMALLGAGKHMVCHKTVYGPSRAILDKTYRQACRARASPLRMSGAHRRSAARSVTARGAARTLVSLTCIIIIKNCTYLCV